MPGSMASSQQSPVGERALAEFLRKEARWHDTYMRREEARQPGTGATAGPVGPGAGPPPPSALDRLAVGGGTVAGLPPKAPSGKPPGTARSRAAERQKRSDAAVREMRKRLAEREVARDATFATEYNRGIAPRQAKPDPVQVLQALMEMEQRPATGARPRSGRLATPSGRLATPLVSRPYRAGELPDVPAAAPRVVPATPAASAKVTTDELSQDIDDIVGDSADGIGQAKAMVLNLERLEESTLEVLQLELEAEDSDEDVDEDDPDADAATRALLPHV